MRGRAINRHRLFAAIVSAAFLVPCLTHAEDSALEAQHAAASALVKAAYDHMFAAIRCEPVFGSAPYNGARVATDNALRAMGLSALSSIEQTERIAARARAQIHHQPDLHLAECMIELAKTEKTLRLRRAILSRQP